MPTPKDGYHLKDGTKVPGTTTILGRFKDSGGLLQWAFQCGKAGQSSLYEKSEVAADIGTIAHGMADAWLRQKEYEYPPCTDEMKAKAQQAFDMFRQWLDQQRAEVIPCEESMVSEKHRFGGTPDILLRNVTLRMSDIKTSNAIYRDHLVQVAAYGILWDENHPDDPITGGYDVLRFAKDFPDFEHRHFGDLNEARELFLLLRPAYDLDLQLKKRCK